MFYNTVREFADIVTDYTVTELAIFFPAGTMPLITVMSYPSRITDIWITKK